MPSGSEGSRFTLRVWGWGCVRRKLCLCPQPFATVRNRLRWRRNTLHSGECCRRGSGNWVKWTCDIAVILAFAEEVSVWAICRASPQFCWHLQRRCLCGCPVLSHKSALTKVSIQSASQKCQVSMSSESVLQECRVRVSSNVWQECPTRVSSKSVLQECQARVSYRSVK